MDPHAAGKERLVVIGNGMAGMRAVEELLSRAPGRYEITVIGAEPHPNYNRIMLSAVLAGEKTVDEIVINSRGWYEENRIRLIGGIAATVIDRSAMPTPAETKFWTARPAIWLKFDSVVSPP